MTWNYKAGVRFHAGDAEILEGGLVQTKGQSSYPWKLIRMRSE